MAIKAASNLNVNQGLNNRLRAASITFDATTVGTVVKTIINQNGTFWDVWQFTSSGTWTPNEHAEADIFVVGGGGGGGCYAGGGGGGGGVVNSGSIVEAGKTYTVTVGAGGNGAQHVPYTTNAVVTRGTIGNFSGFFDLLSSPAANYNNPIYTTSPYRGIYAKGGGVGGNGNEAVVNSATQATGGGSHVTYAVGTGTAGDGYSGGQGAGSGNCGGGGSVRAVGGTASATAGWANGGVGANGLLYWLTNQYYGGGGGGSGGGTSGTSPYTITGAAGGLGEVVQPLVEATLQTMQMFRIQLLFQEPSTLEVEEADPHQRFLV